MAVRSGREALDSISPYLNGRFLTGESRHVLRDVNGLDCCMLDYATSSQIRGVKRKVNESILQLQRVPIVKIISFIERLGDQLVSEYDIDLVGRLSGATKATLEFSLKKRIAFCFTIRRFVEQFLDTGIVACDPNRTNSTSTIRVPGAPVIAILPKNSDEEAFYVVVQALIARCPCVLRCPSSGLASVPAIFLARAISNVARNSGCEYDQIIANSVSIFSTPHEAHPGDVINSLFINDSTWVLFGSSSTVLDCRLSIQAIGQSRAILEFGSGLGIALVTETADTELASCEVANSITYNNGNECIGTKLVYAHSSQFQEVVSRVQQKCGEFHHNGPWGVIGAEKWGSLRRIMVEQFGIDRSIESAMPCVQLRGREEVPVLIPSAPMASFYQYDSLDDGIQLIQSHLEFAKMRRALSLSLFGDEKHEQLVTIASLLKPYVLRVNRGTHRMDMMAPHQGMVLWELFMDEVTLENYR